MATQTKVSAAHTHLLPTAVGQLRSRILVTASVGTIAIAGGPGTLSEIAQARAAGKPVVTLESWRTARFGSHESEPGISIADSPEKAVEYITHEAIRTSFEAGQAERNALTLQRWQSDNSRMRNERAPLVAIVGPRNPSEENLGLIYEVARGLTAGGAIPVCLGNGTVADAIGEAASAQKMPSFGFVEGSQRYRRSEHHYLRNPNG